MEILDRESRVELEDEQACYEQIKFNFKQWEQQNASRINFINKYYIIYYYFTRHLFLTVFTFTSAEITKAHIPGVASRLYCREICNKRTVTISLQEEGCGNSSLVC